MDDTYRVVILRWTQGPAVREEEGGRAADSRLTRNVWNSCIFMVVEVGGWGAAGYRIIRNA